MKNLFRIFRWTLVAGIGCALHAQSFVVGVSASYTDGGSSGQLTLGNPVNLTVSGSGDQSDSTKLEMSLDEPVLLSVVPQDIGSYQVVFTPPPGFWMMINGVRQTVYTGSPAWDCRVTLVRRERTTPTDSPVGEASSIQDTPPSAAIHISQPFIAFNLGNARNGDPLPLLRIPVVARTTSDANFVLPDTPEIQGMLGASAPVLANGGFQFSVPQAEVKLEVHPDNSGAFDLSFMSPGTGAPFVIYHYQSLPAKSRFEKEIPSVPDGAKGRRYETTRQPYSGPGSASAATGIRVLDNWLIEDWHTIESAPGRVIAGSCTSQTQGSWGVDTFGVSELITMTSEVRPAENSSTIVSKTTSLYNLWRIGPWDNSFALIFPKQTTTGVGDGDLVTQDLTDPNFENVRVTKMPSGRMHIENDDGQLGVPRITYETWLNDSPSVTKPNGIYTINENNALKTVFQRETNPLGLIYEWPSSIVRTAATKLLSKATFTYTQDGDDHPIVTATRKDYSLNTTTDYVETITKRFRPDDPDFSLRDRVYSVQAPAGAKQSFAYASGAWSGAEGGGWSADYRIVTLSGAATGGTQVTGLDAATTVDSLQLHTNKSTKTVEYLQRGRLVRREIWVYVSGGGTAPVFSSAPVVWETFGYTDDGRLNKRENSAGGKYSADWAGTRMTGRRDETGLETKFTYDDLDRLKSMTQAAASGVGEQSISFVYDAAHRIVKRIVGPVDTNGDPTNDPTTTANLGTGAQHIVTETIYDRAGRAKEIREPGQGTTGGAGTIVTLITYPNGGLDTKTTFNTGASQTVARFIDGHVQSVTGSATVEEHYSYDFDGFSRLRVTRTLGPQQKRQTIVVSDLLGRVVEQRMNGFGSSGASRPLVNYFEYDPASSTHKSTGLLNKTFSLEQGSTANLASGTRLLRYDAFGQLTASGIDLNANDVLDAASTDRFVEVDASFVNENNVWLRRVTSTRYHTDNSAASHVSRTDTQLTALSGVLAQSVSYDYYGNPTTRTVLPDPTGHTHRIRTKFADGTTTEQGTVGGLPIFSRTYADIDPNLTSPPALATTYAYDALGRVRFVTDARTGSTETRYWYGTALPSQQYDARGVLTSSLGYDAAGRLAWVTTPATNVAPASTVNYLYTARSELYEQSGLGTHESRRTYTDYGELSQLKTYRSGLAGTADTTTWAYDDNTGWLVSKSDATGATGTVSYDYAFSNGYRDVTVESARDPSHPCVQRYAVDTGDLLSVTYGDGTTPNVSFDAYDREGDLLKVTDATGQRTFAYENGQLRTETLPTWFNNLVLTTDYHTATSTASNTLKGRYYRWQLGSATDADREMSVTYGFDDLGRVNGVTAAYKAQGSRDPLSVSAAYTYKPNSSLWETFTQTSAASTTFGVTRAFEANRDVLTSITSAHTTVGTVATFGYGTDAAGRREWGTQSGMAFQDFVETAGDATYYRYTYNAADELTAATGYHGTNPAATTSPLPGRGFGFSYDGAGNRKVASVSGENASYWGTATPGTSGNEGANSLNQVRSRGTLATHVSGTSEKTATVTVAGATASRESSPGRYWDSPVASPSTGAGYNSSITVSATLSGDSQSKSVQALARPSPDKLGYDADGNLTEDAQWRYEWDAENRLKRMYTNPGGEGALNASAIDWGAPNRELRFTYDYLGRRVRKESWLDGTKVGDTKFIYQGWSLIAELDATTTNKIVRSYAWGLDLDGSVGGTGHVGGLVLETLHTDTALTAYHVSYDGNGNVAALVNRGTGQIAAAYEYGPFGENVRTQTLDATLIAKGQPFRWSTKFTDSETGLVYYGHRYYDANLGRFINRDPLGEAGGRNLYGFCSNDPVNGVDVLGMKNLWELLFGSSSTAREGGSAGENKKDEDDWSYTISIPLGLPYDDVLDETFEGKFDFGGDMFTVKKGTPVVGRVDSQNKVLRGDPSAPNSEPSVLNNMWSATWSGLAKGVISAAQGLKGAAVNAIPGFGLLEAVAPDTAVVQFSQGMDVEAARLKRGVEENIVGLTGADNKTSYVFAGFDVLGEFTSASLVGAEFAGAIKSGGQFLSRSVAAESKVLVIGENMSQRVIPYAEKIGAEIYPGMPGYNSTLRAEALLDNGLYIEKAKELGYRIIDIGPDFAKRAATGTGSEAYQLERFLTKDYAGYEKAFTR